MFASPFGVTVCLILDEADMMIYLELRVSEVLNSCLSQRTLQSMKYPTAKYANLEGKQIINCCCLSAPRLESTLTRRALGM
jgi:hypothetical protein